MDASKPESQFDLDLLRERQRMERALRDSEALYESLVESLSQNIFRKDLEGRFSYVNRRFCETLGRTRAEILGRTDFDFFAVEMATKYVVDDRHVIETGRPVELIEDLPLPNGDRHHIQVVKTAVLDAQGDIVGVQGIFWDITEKRVAEEKLAQSERRYRQLTEATLDAILLADEAGNLQLFNPAAERMFGYLEAEVIGKPAEFLDSLDFRALHADSLARFVGGGSQALGSTREMTARRKDGEEIPVEVALSVLGSPEGGLRFLAAVRDLTERSKLRATLVQNEKLASIGLLSAGVAHEINNPLSFVSNNLVVLQRDCLALMEMVNEIDAHRARLPEDLARFWTAKADDLDLAYVRDNLARLLGRTREGVDRVSRIVHSLRGMARTDPPRRQDINLAELIDSTLEIIQGKYKCCGIEVIREHPTPPLVHGVSTQLSQVILNLLVNAFQAVESLHPDEGGKIFVRTKRIVNEIRLEVEDNGPGPHAEPAKRDGGVGLRNLRARLARLYGSGAGVVLSERPEGGTEAVLRVPFRVAPVLT